MKPTHASITFGRRLAALRQARGLTQEDAAARLGVATLAISAYELGRRQPSLTMLPEIAAVYGVAVGELFEAAPTQ